MHLADKLWSLLAPLPPELQTFCGAAIPLLEVRAAVPYALGILKLSVSAALLWNVLGSWCPAFFVVFVLEHIEPFLRKIKFFSDLLDRIYAKTRAKSAQIQKWDFWGLVIFIGIPLPGTGVWTGSLAGYLLGLNRWKIIIASLLGTLLASILMIVFTLTVITAFSFFA